MKIGYQQSSRLTYWWIDGQFDLQDAQTAPTREAIARFFMASTRSAASHGCRA
ncbi:hypothetical protein MMB19_07270 [Ralstonia insidiosa]|nr:hypothetical protein MMB19_07270 [Ralstonia insidiosa]